MIPRAFEKRKNDSLAGFCFSVQNKKNTKMMWYLPDFLRTHKWLLYSLDITRMEYSGWQRRVCPKPCRYLESLNKSLQEECMKILGNELQHIDENFFKRFWFYIKAKGCNFGNLQFFCKSQICILSISNLILIFVVIKRILC